MPQPYTDEDGNWSADDVAAWRAATEQNRTSLWTGRIHINFPGIKCLLTVDGCRFNVLRLMGGVSSLGCSSGISEADIIHAVEHAIVIVDLDADADPPKVLFIGPAQDAQLLEVIILNLSETGDSSSTQGHSDQLSTTCCLKEAPDHDHQAQALRHPHRTRPERC